MTDELKEWWFGARGDALNSRGGVTWSVKEMGVGQRRGIEKQEDKVG